MKNVLHVGCGPDTKAQLPTYFASDDWEEMRFDIDPQHRPDVIGTMTDMSAVLTDSTDALYSSHNVEHLYPHEVGIALREFHRVLRADGVAIVRCPDLRSVCRHIADGNLLEPVYTASAGPVSPIDMIYGLRTETRSGNHFFAHKCGFILEVLIAALRQAGFATVAAGTSGYELWAVARKSAVSDEAIRNLAREILER
jgi:hypothetical protein